MKPVSKPEYDAFVAAAEGSVVKVEMETQVQYQARLTRRPVAQHSLNPDGSEFGHEVIDS